jgi:rubrerythrin
MSTVLSSLFSICVEQLRKGKEYDYLQERMKNDGSEASPSKAVVSELQDLRAELRESASSYAARLDAEIERVRQAVETAGGNSSGAKIRDLRDMLTLLRHRQLKPDKGRRKDLKKIESVVNDLTMLIENW